MCIINSISYIGCLSIAYWLPIAYCFVDSCVYVWQALHPAHFRSCRCLETLSHDLQLRLGRCHDFDASNSVLHQNESIVHEKGINYVNMGFQKRYEAI